MFPIARTISVSPALSSPIATCFAHHHQTYNTIAICPFVFCHTVTETVMGRDKKLAPYARCRERLGKLLRMPIITLPLTVFCIASLCYISHNEEEDGSGNARRWKSITHFQPPFAPGDPNHASMNVALFNHHNQIQTTKQVKLVTNEAFSKGLITNLE